MTIHFHPLSAAALLLAAASLAAGQTSFLDSAKPSPSAIPTPGNGAPLPDGVAIQPLLDFKESEIKFSLQSLTKTLRDGRHEGWVLAAYPDPKTKRPLIGAGFSLDVPFTEHPQRDPLNPHPFLEPSSAQLWQAAGLEPERLQRILDRYDRDLKTWTAKRYRRKIKAKALTPEVTDEEAMRLLRISAIQAIYNAKAYCRGFDQLAAPQQMALSQLVFQMGVNLEEFAQFLAAINSETPASGLLSPEAPTEPSDADRWKTVQNTLIDSQWARLYTNRALTVIAMFDPDYSDDPSEAQRRVEATLRPAPLRRRKSGAFGSPRTATYNRRGGRIPYKDSPCAPRKRKLRAV